MVCSFFNKYSKRLKCIECLEKPFIPIENYESIISWNNELILTEKLKQSKEVICLTCLNDKIYNYINHTLEIYDIDKSQCENIRTVFDITNQDIVFWRNCEKTIVNKIVRCKYCKIECVNLEHLHYHLYHKLK